MRGDRIKHKKKPHPFRWEMRVHHGGQVQTKLKVSNSGKMLKHYFKISNTFFFSLSRLPHTYDNETNLWIAIYVVIHQTNRVVQNNTIEIGCNT